MIHEKESYIDEFMFGDFLAGNIDMSLLVLLETQEERIENALQCGLPLNNQVLNDHAPFEAATGIPSIGPLNRYWIRKKHVYFCKLNAGLEWREVSEFQPYNS